MPTFRQRCRARSDPYLAVTSGVCMRPGAWRGSSASPELPMGRKPMTDRIPARIIETVDPSQPIRLTPAQSGGPIHTQQFRTFPQPAPVGRRPADAALLRHRLAELERAPGGAVGPGPAAVPHLRRHLLRPGFHPALGDPDHRRVRPVLHHRAGRAHLGAATPARRAPGPGCSYGWKRSPKATACSASSSMLHAGPPPSCCAVPPSTRCGWPSAWPRRWPRRLFHPGTRAGGRPCPLRGRRHHRLLAAVLHRRDLHQCRLAA